MKFGKRFKAAQIREWQTQYLDYKALKKAINKLAEHKKVLDVYGKKLSEENEFTKLQQKELDRINEFYVRTEERYCERHGQLVDQLERLVRMHIFYNLQHVLQRKNKDNKSKQTLVQAWREHYKALSYLNDFRKLNLQAFQKIYKKYRKYTGLDTKKMMKKVKKSPFASSPILEFLIDNTEYYFILELFGGKRKKAMAEVRPFSIEKNMLT